MGLTRRRLLRHVTDAFIRRALACALALAMTLIAGLATADGASAACETGVTGVLATAKTFSWCGGEQSYTVPLGTTAVRVTAAGGHGGNRYGLGGASGSVTSVVNVPLGTSTLYVEVGGSGDQGGFNGGGSGSRASDMGGGGSDVRTTSCGTSCPGAPGSTTLNSRLIVGGGGGGAGGCVSTGGSGGADAPGNGGDAGKCTQDTIAAKGGTLTAGGAGASDSFSSGGTGVAGTGGSATNADAGSGGGGYFGGGGANSTRASAGGSSYGPADATFTFASTASVTVTPIVASSTSVGSSSNPSQYRQSVTFTATVTSSTGTPNTGTVQFYEGSTALGSAQTVDSTGKASVSTSSLSIADHSISAVYSGGGGWAGSTSGTLTQRVGPTTTDTTVASGTNPSRYGGSVTFTATVTPSIGTLDGGTVQFYDGNTALGSPQTVNTSTGKATLSTSSLSLGSHTITADYGGTTTYVASGSSSLTQTVNQATTSTAVASGPSSPTYGQQVTFTATVTPGSGTLDGGTVQFYDGGTAIGTAQSVDTSTGKATYATTALKAGSHTITATYGGTTNFQGSTSSGTTQAVGKSGTSTAVDSSEHPSSYGDDVTFTATVTPVAGALDGGTVQFYDGSTAIGSARTVDTSTGKATYDTASLSVGSHDITAVYSGDSNFTTSTSPAFTQVVGKSSSTTAVDSDTNPSTFGQSVKFTATVGSAHFTPTGGTVQFYDGTDTLGSPATVDGSGKATLTIANLDVGTHGITAVYSGDSSFTTSTSASLSQIVTRAPTTTALDSDTNPSTYGQSVKFTATVTPQTGALDGGTVQFYDGTDTLGSPQTVDTSSGKATLTVADLSVAGHDITAEYSGNSNFLTSTSATLSQTVGKASTTTAVDSDANPSTFGQSVKFTATVDSDNFTPDGGTVQFYDGTDTLGSPATVNGSGKATLTIANLDVGTHGITAVYSGNGSFVGSTSPNLDQVVTAAPTTTAVDSDIHPSTFGQSVKFTATITPQTGSLDGGTVQFYDGSDTLGSPQTVDTSTDTGTLDVSSLDVATHTITAVYSGNDDFDTSTSPDFTQEVDKAPTTTAVDSDTHPSTFGQSVKFTATITPQTGALDGGTVQFYDGSDTLGSPQTVDTSTDTATLDVSSLDVATHTITAVYSGNDDFETSTSPDFTQEVDKAPTTTAVDSDTNPSAYAQSVKFTATIDSADATPDGGTVQFYDGADPLGSPQSVGADGKASYTTAALSATSHQITASYSGNGSFEGGNSAALTQTVGKAATTTTVGSLDPVAYGQNVELRATVSSQDAVPDGGTVQFYDGSDALGGPRPVGADGKAAYTTTTPLEVGDHSITAVYSGDGRFLTSDSHATPVVQRITRDASSVTVDGTAARPPSAASSTSPRPSRRATATSFRGRSSSSTATRVSATRSRSTRRRTRRRCA